MRVLLSDTANVTVVDGCCRGRNHIQHATQKRLNHALRGRSAQGNLGVILVVITQVPLRWAATTTTGPPTSSPQPGPQITPLTLSIPPLPPFVFFPPRTCVRLSPQNPALSRIFLLFASNTTASASSTSAFPSTLEAALVAASRALPTPELRGSFLRKLLADPDDPASAPRWRGEGGEGEGGIEEGED